MAQIENKGRILVTGATGFAGSAIVPALLSAGWTVRACGRDESRRPKHCDFVSIDIAEVNDLSPLVNDMDAILHLAARVHVMRETATDPLAEFRRANVAPTSRLLDAAVRSGVKHFVFASSLKVHGEASFERPIREDDPLHPDDAYGLSKMEAESAVGAVSSTGALRTTIFRLPLMYGPGVKGNFQRLAKLVATGVPLPFASITNRRSMLYIGNLCSAIIADLNRVSMGHDTFLLSDCHDVSTADLIRVIASALNRPARLFSLPSTLLRLAAATVGYGGEIRRLTDSLQVDTGHIQAVLGWKPPHSFEQGVRQTIQALADISRTAVSR